jgi:hypothetical protein
MTTMTTITDECPAGGAHTPGWAEDNWGRLHAACDECGATPPPYEDDPIPQSPDNPPPWAHLLRLPDMTNDEDDPF